MTPILVFDIETVPDLPGIRRTNDLPVDLPDDGVREWFNQKRRAATGSDFAPHFLQQVVAIACALRHKDELKIWSVGDIDDPEPELIRRFFGGIEQLTPQLVSWNGGGFDLPVLNHRALIHGITAEKYWDWGDQDREFKWNSYLGRYHTRHLDLMDVLARFFFPKHGSVVEDPGTGSACANLGGWLLATGAALPQNLVVDQGEAVGRPCRLGLEVTSDRRILVSGRVIEIARGTVTF